MEVVWGWGVLYHSEKFILFFIPWGVIGFPWQMDGEMTRGEVKSGNKSRGNTQRVPENTGIHTINSQQMI